MLETARLADRKEGVMADLKEIARRMYVPNKPRVIAKPNTWKVYKAKENKWLMERKHENQL